MVFRFTEQGYLFIRKQTNEVEMARESLRETFICFQRIHFPNLTGRFRISN